MREVPPRPVPIRTRSEGAETGTLVDWAHENLLSMLVSMEIAPGARIGIDAVARTLGISPTPIREALSRLEAEKLVYKVPNVGYRAASQMTREGLHELYTLRMLIEPFAAREAAAEMNDVALRELSGMEADLAEGQSGRDEGYARFASADARLHRLIATGSGNRFLAEAIQGLHVHLHIFRFLFRTNAPEEAATEHQRLIEALLARDPDGAEAAMRAHLEESRVRVDRALAQHLGEQARAAG
jgi:DNA-binding GntR family transcriptional regulator